MPAARNAGVFVRMANNPDRNDPDIATHFQYRQHHSNTADESLAAQLGSSVADTNYPLWLRIKRTGDRIEGFQSADGTSFTKVGGDEGGVTLPRLPARIYIGFALSNHRDNEFVTARFDANSIRFE